MFDDLVWINSPRCFTEIAGLRAAAPSTPTTSPGHRPRRAGILHQSTEGRRNRKYEAREVLAALDAFAESTARRHQP